MLRFAQVHNYFKLHSNSYVSLYYLNNNNRQVVKVIWREAYRNVHKSTTWGDDKHWILVATMLTYQLPATRCTVGLSDLWHVHVMTKCLVAWSSRILLAACWWHHPILCCLFLWNHCFKLQISGKCKCRCPNELHPYNCWGQQLSGDIFRERKRLAALKQLSYGTDHNSPHKCPVPWGICIHQSSPKLHLNQLSHFCTAYRKVCLCFTMGRHFSPKVTPSSSVQPFLQGSWTWQLTETDWPRYSNNSAHSGTSNNNRQWLSNTQ